MVENTTLNPEDARQDIELMERSEKIEFTARDSRGYSEGIETAPDSEFLDKVTRVADVISTRHTYRGEPGVRCAVTYMAKGCSWRNNAERPHCHFCTWPEDYSTQGRVVLPEHYEAQQENALTRIESDITRLDIYNSGSFFDEEEWSRETHKEIMGHLLGLPMPNLDQGLRNLSISALQEERREFLANYKQEVSDWELKLSRLRDSLSPTDKIQNFNDAKIEQLVQWQDAITSFLRPLSNAPETLKTIMVESKLPDLFDSGGNPNRFAEEKIQFVLNQLKGIGRGKVDLIVAFGLETLDSQAGEAIRKQTTDLRLQETMFKLEQFGITTQLYCLDKPFLSSEEHAINSTVETVKKVAELTMRHGNQLQLKPVISLAPTRIFEDSLLSYYPSARLRQLRWWPMVESLQQLFSDPKISDSIDLQLGLSDEGVAHAEGGDPKNCEVCNDTVEAALLNFDETQNSDAFNETIDAVLELKCPCRTSWEKHRYEPKIEKISRHEMIRQDQLSQVAKVEKSAWPADQQATRELFEQRAAIFPEGFFLAVEDFHTTGVLTSEIVNFDPDLPSSNWSEVTGNGTISTHNPEGNALYIVSLGVEKEYQDKATERHGYGIGSTLVTFSQGLAQRRNLPYVILSARIPEFAEVHQAYPDITVEDYVYSLREKDGQSVLYDKELRFYLRHGFEIKDVVNGSMIHDAESLDYGVTLVWKNPSYISKKKS